MGQEISQTQFEQTDFEMFYRKLEQETVLLKQMFRQNAFSELKPKVGFEIEAWLVDDRMRPAAINQHYLETLNDPMASPELAKFNIELNSEPLSLTGDVFRQMHTQLQTTWEKVSRHARTLNHHVLTIGILPSLQQADLTLANMSEMHRYHALNEQILRVRGKPVHIDIGGTEHLRFDHDDVMLESATTSFQLHIQLPLAIAHHFYNASIIASAAMVAISANSPFLFGKALWQETRIPLFEQAIETGGYFGAAQGPLRRVSFGSDFTRQSLAECFHENLEHFPVLLPVNLGEANKSFSHVRLHNGTIWRWNRPLVGFDEDGTPHIRIEHRVPAAAPTVIDAIANAAFYYGLSQNLSDEIIAKGLPMSFAQAKVNFYQTAQHGLDSVIVWFDGNKHRLDNLILTELLPRAVEGLTSLGVSRSDINTYLDIVRHRIQHKRTGSHWQCRFMKFCDQDVETMLNHYLAHQTRGNPVSHWEFK